jgi:ankyrin repeat protein
MVHTSALFTIVRITVSSAFLSAKIVLHHLATMLLHSNGHTEVARMLLDHGADGNLSHPSLLHFASRGAHSETVQMLLARGAEADSRDRLCLTPLFHACYLGHAHVAKIFLAHGADVDASELNGRSLLHMACLREKAEVVGELLSATDDVSKATPYGAMPFTMACQFQNESVARLLFDFGNSRGLTPVYAENKVELNT